MENLSALETNHPDRIETTWADAQKLFQDADLEMFISRSQHNYIIYKKLLNPDYQKTSGNFEPLEFFKLYAAFVVYLKQNCRRPLAVKETFLNFDLPEKQKTFLFFEAVFYLQNIEENGESDDSISISICINELFDAVEPGFELMSEQQERAIKRDMEQRIIKKLAEFDSINEKLRWLKTEIAEFEYSVSPTKLEDFANDDFTSYYYLKKQLQKYTALAELEQTENVIKLNKAENKKEKRAFGGTQEQNILAMYILLESLQARGTITDTGKFISFLTGFSPEKCRQQLSKVFSKANDDFISFAQDAELVKEHFEKLKLTELVRMIDNEVAKAETDSEHNL